MRIAVLANANSFWTQRYIEKIAIPLEQQICLITPENDNYAQFYLENGIHVMTTKPKRKSVFGHKMDALLTLINTILALDKAKVDIIHVHYAHLYILKLLLFFHKQEKLIITYWGSDLLRTTSQKLLSVKKTVYRADKLVVMTAEMKNILVDKYGAAIYGKIDVIDFGISAFDAIDKIRRDRYAIREELFGKDYVNRLAITVGYNAGKGQQHVRVLDTLSKLPPQVKEKLLVVLPLTYQREDKKYLKIIKQNLKNSNLQGIVLEEFMGENEIAKLCVAVDVFINAQITDALSASMLEYLYADCIVLSGDWMKYSFLDTLGIRYLRFHTFEELSQIIEEIVGGRRKESDTPKADILKQHCSWEESRRKWNVLYQSI